MKRTFIWLLASDFAAILMDIAILAFVLLDVNGGCFKYKTIVIVAWIFLWALSNILIRKGFKRP